MNTRKIKRKLLLYLKQNYKLNSYGIHLKYYHTIRVANIMKRLAKHLNLPKEDIQLAFVLGLFHDFARFNQWAQFNCFDDIKTKDHGDWAVELLFNNNLIRLFDIKEEYYSILKVAIQEHNKYKVNETITDEKTLLFCNMIRDADKLDIFKLIINRKTKNPYNDRQSITKEVKEAIEHCNLVDKNYVNTKLDVELMHLGLVYGLNFRFSYRWLNKINYFNHMKKKVSNNFTEEEIALLTPLLKMVENYANKKLGI